MIILKFKKEGYIIMKYAVLTGNEKFEMREGEIKVKRNPIIKVTHIGVCGTDLSYWKDGASYKDIVIGHEYSGIIEEPGTTGLFKKGDRVAGYTQNVDNEPCGHCENCLKEDFDNCTNKKVITWKGGELSHPGSYSEYTTWFPKSIYKLPEGVSNEEAALIEPFTVSLHAVTLTEVKPGDKVLILGGGIIGLGVSEWLRTFGASEITITEINQQKIETIKSYKIADHVIKADAKDLDEQLREASDGGYDIVFDCAGVESAVNAGIRALKNEKKKKITCIALPHSNLSLDYKNIVLRETILRGSKGHTPSEFKAVISAVENNRISLKKYISKRIKFENVQQGFEELKKSAGLETKAIIEME